MAWVPSGCVQCLRFLMGSLIESHSRQDHKNAQVLQPDVVSSLVYWSVGPKVLVFVVLRHQCLVWFPSHTTTIPNTDPSLSISHTAGTSRTGGSD